MEKIGLSVNLVNALLGYLGKRPYEETFQLISAIQEEAKQEEKEKDDRAVSE